MSLTDPVLEVVEGLAERIQRSVAVDDADFNYLAHSTHRFGDEDQIRLRSITARQLAAPIRDYVMSMNVESQRKPIFIPATHDHGFDHDRLLVPIRSSNRLVGVIWIIHSPTFSDDDQKACVQAAERLASLILSSTDSNDDAIFDRHLRDLVSDDSTSRLLAVEALHSRGFFCAESAVLTIAISRGDSAKLTDEQQHGMRHAWSQSTVHYRSRAFTSHSDTHAFGLLEVPAKQTRDEILRICDAFRTTVSLRNPECAGSLFLGVSSPREFEEVHFGYREALSAIRTGMRSNQPIVLCVDQPLEALLDVAVDKRIPIGSLPALFRDNIRTVNAEVLDTVSRYLDSAGSAVRVSEEQHLHRASVYYRIRQFEKHTGLNLKSGRDRLLVHLWLHVQDRVEA